MGNVIQVTRQTLEAGAKSLGIKLPPKKDKATDEHIEELISRHLIKVDPNFGRYACEGCGKDTSSKLPVCPFCGSEYIPEVDDTPVQAAPTENPWTEEAVEEPQQETPKEAAQEASPPEPSPAPSPMTRTRRQARTRQGKKKPAPVAKPRQKREKKEKKAKPAAATKQKGKQSRAGKKMKRQRAEKEKQKKREQIKKALPFSLEQLNGMKRTALIMTAGVLGVKNPMKLGSDDNIIQAILDAQHEQYGR